MYAIFLILLLTFICIAVILILITFRYYYYKTCIILTCTVNIKQNVSSIKLINPKKRLEIYIQAIKNWLENTNFPIILVENSGYPFMEMEFYLKKYKKRFDLIIFDETKLDQSILYQYGAIHLSKYPSKGTSEMVSIFHAFHLSKLSKRCDFFIKITGRYFIPEFETFLIHQKIFNYDAIRQNNPNRCEIVGVCKNLFHQLFKPNDFKNKKGFVEEHVENLYKERIIQNIHPKKILVCKKFNIEPTLSGGTGKIITEL